MSHTPAWKQRKDTEKEQTTNRLILAVEDLSRTIRQLCNTADISASQKQALTEAHKWLAEFGTEQYDYDRKDYKHHGNRK